MFFQNKHDSDFFFQELSAIMGDTSINMRDPIFYRWHAYINYLFERYKDTLPPYEEKQVNLMVQYELIH